MLIDTHAHLDFPDFESDLDEVLQRANDAGVTRILTVGTSLESSRRAIVLAEKHAMIYAIVGVHPGNVSEAPEDIREALDEMARHPKVAALGETGLDYRHLPGRDSLSPSTDIQLALGAQQTADILHEGLDREIMARQAALFSQHLEVAGRTGLNVVIHQREAWADTLAVMEQADPKTRAVFHCFTGSRDQAEQLIAAGHLVSFTGIVTFKNAASLLELAAELPAGSFMVETDCPYLAPVPERGRRCEPRHVRLTAEAVASTRKIALETLEAETTATAGAFFRFQA